MTLTVEATWQDGVLKPRQPVCLPEGTDVSVSIFVHGDDPDPLAAVIGIGDGPATGDAADQHDAYIYGKQQP